MSTLSSPGERYPWIRRIATPLAHWYPGVLVGYLAVRIAVDVTRVTGTVELLVAFAAGSALVAGIAASIWHTRRLCERCASNVPLDGPAETQRDRWMLRGVHLGWKVRLVTYTTLNLAGAFVEPVEYLVLAVLAVDSVAVLRHCVLQPWCPWCHWRRDDDEEVPDPEPIPTGHAHA